MKHQFITSMLELGAALELSCSKAEAEAIIKEAGNLYDSHILEKREKKVLVIGSGSVGDLMHNKKIFEALEKLSISTSKSIETIGNIGDVLSFQELKRNKDILYPQNRKKVSSIRGKFKGYMRNNKK